MRIVLIILAVLLGEITLILLTTIAQEVLFDGINYHASSISTIVLGGFCTFLAASLSGLIARLIGRQYSLIIPSVISFIIIAEMMYLIVSGITQDPIWFDVLSGSGLIIGIWIGYHYKESKIPIQKKNSGFQNLHQE